MLMHYDSTNDSFDVSLEERECDRETATVELALGLSVLLLKFCDNYIPSKKDWPVFHELILEMMEENLSDFMGGIWEL